MFPGVHSNDNTKKSANLWHILVLLFFLFGGGDGGWRDEGPLGFLQDEFDPVEADVDRLAGDVALAGMDAVEAHFLGVEFEVVVAELGDVEGGFDVEGGYFEEDGEGFDAGDDGGIDAGGVLDEVGVGEAEFFELEDRGFGFEREALFFGAGGGDGVEVGVGGEFVGEKALDDEVGIAADGAGEVAVVLEGEAVVADIVGGVLGEAHAADKTDGELGEEGGIFGLLEEGLDVSVVGGAGELEAEGAGKVVKVLERFCGGLFVDAVDERFALVSEVDGDEFVGFEHELFDHLVGDVVLDSLDALRHAFVIDDDDVV